MAGADYLLCSVCSAKTIYDAELDYDTGNLAQIAALCTGCAEAGYKLITYDPTPIQVTMTRVEPKEAPDMAMLVKADMTGRIAIGGEYRGREFSLYRQPSGLIELVPLPMAADEDNPPPYPVPPRP